MADRLSVVAAAHAELKKLSVWAVTSALQGAMEQTAVDYLTYEGKDFPSELERRRLKENIRVFGEGGSERANAAKIFARAVPDATTPETQRIKDELLETLNSLNLEMAKREIRLEIEQFKGNDLDVLFQRIDEDTYELGLNASYSDDPSVRRMEGELVADRRAILQAVRDRYEAIRPDAPEELSLALS